MEEKIKLRDKLADIALQWQASFGVAPSITSSISEYDAAMLVGMSEKEYSDYMRDKTAVAKGTDFVYRNIKYQVKANRPSGKKGSFVTKVPKASNYLWDKLIWILYDKNYMMQEAWEWNVVYVDTLWVDSSYRGKKLGSLLLEEVENDAKSKGAKLIHLDTFDFQAKEFYEKQGYIVFGILENCPEKHYRYYLKKVL